MNLPPKGFDYRIPVFHAKLGKVYRLLTERARTSDGPLVLINCVDTHDEWSDGAKYQQVPDTPCVVAREYNTINKFYAVLLVGDQLIRMGDDFSYQSTGIKTWLEEYETE